MPIPIDIHIHTDRVHIDVERERETPKKLPNSSTAVLSRTSLKQLSACVRGGGGER